MTDQRRDRLASFWRGTALTTITGVIASLAIIVVEIRDDLSQAEGRILALEKNLEFTRNVMVSLFVQDREKDKLKKEKPK